MTPDFKICPDCGSKIYRKYNSTLWNECKCKSQARSKERIEKNNAILAQSQTEKIKGSKNGLKSKRGKTERQKAMDRADMWFSRYIRLKYSFEQSGKLFCKCYTCGNPKGIKNIDNGHFQRRGSKTTRFDENNARPQCKQCNYYHSGEFEKFEIKLIKDIGQKNVNELKKLSQSIGEDNEIFYREQANKYRILFNKLLKVKSVKNPWK